MDVTKIIKATAVRGRTSTAAPIIKEDYGLYLLIGGIDLPEVYEVDFSNDEHAGTSVTMVGNADGVLIPNQFIKSGKDVFAFYYHVGEDFGRTLYTIRIPNKLRPDRTDIEPTPAEQSTIDQLIGALNSAVEQTGEDVDSASQSAQSAESAKTAAESARDTAGEYANDAESSAASASTSASQASTSATASAESAEQAAQSEQSANTSANNASRDADRAEQAANNAGYLDVEIVDGRLIYARTDAVDVDFALDDGRLIMEAI